VPTFVAQNNRFFPATRLVIGYHDYVAPWDHRMRCINNFIHGGDLESDVLFAHRDTGQSPTVVETRHDREYGEFLREAFEIVSCDLTPRGRHVTG